MVGRGHFTWHNSGEDPEHCFGVTVLRLTSNGGHESLFENVPRHIARFVAENLHNPD
jgi:hypothetical protein